MFIQPGIQAPFRSGFHHKYRDWSAATTSSCP
jgi:hypothetical protein